MIRLVLLLCGGLYLTAVVLGADHGQKRHGLMLADQRPKAQVDTEVVSQKTVFIPAQPVMQAAPAPLKAIVPEPQVEPVAPGQTKAELQTAALDTSPQPEISGGLLYTVAVVQANVRGGPGRSFAVLDTLSRGEQVLVIVEDQPLEGWSRVRIEGDGIEGYVSTKLLTRSE